ncbi:hypothetical protein [Streptomyces sp. MS191]|uniref:hypothetical protein n=1 Tax=Streptomyces sp. ms191 TaxID=1827978 RepID=UPI0011CD582A|nr:hypothetical protein [Streptomyces sp. ms191]
MADEGTAQRRNESASAHASVRVEFVPAEKMPDGCNVVLLNVGGAHVVAVRERQMTEDLRAEVNELLEGVVACGLWPPHPVDTETPRSRPH